MYDTADSGLGNWALANVAGALACDIKELLMSILNVTRRLICFRLLIKYLNILIIFENLDLLAM